MHAVGLFDAKTHFSHYVARAEAGEEVIIMRHNKPVAKIVPLTARASAVEIPKYVQRTFDMGVPLVDLSRANKLIAELDSLEFLKLNARLERELNKRKNALDKKSKAATPHEAA